MNDPKLVIVSSAPVMISADGSYVMTQKFVEGVLRHQAEWPGRVQVIARAAEVMGNNLDYRPYAADDLPFDIIVDRNGADAPTAMASSAVTMLMLFLGQAREMRFCRRNRIPHVVVSEYTLRTRQMINRANHGRSLRRYAKDLLEAAREVEMRRAVRGATGVQCNGTPTYAAYKPLNDRAMLYFDTRVEGQHVANPKQVERRLSLLRSGRPLHLAFSGRLIAMKGADHLVAVAARLKSLGRAFRFSICGSGELEPAMRDAVMQEDLGRSVEFRGNLDFATELMPFMRDEVDLFVCCHRQGDPSCTYLETMSCGVPIIGYDNEAWAGLSQISGTGWTTPMNAPGELADRIASLDADTIEDHTWRSLAFARDHSFDVEFSRRMAHLRTIAGTPSEITARQAS
jgi:colanic acid/amylovoran biosynthesis glycosyltransferase